MQSTDSTKIYAYETSTDIVTEKEESTCNSIITRYKEWLILTILYKNQKKKIIPIGHNFFITYTKY